MAQTIRKVIVWSEMWFLRFIFLVLLPSFLVLEDPLDNKIHFSNYKIQIYNHKIQLDPDGKASYDLDCIIWIVNWKIIATLLTFPWLGNLFSFGVSSYESIYMFTFYLCTYIPTHECVYMHTYVQIYNACIHYDLHIYKLKY